MNQIICTQNNTKLPRIKCQQPLFRAHTTHRTLVFVDQHILTNSNDSCKHHFLTYVRKEYHTFLIMCAHSIREAISTYTQELTDRFHHHPLDIRDSRYGNILVSSRPNSIARQVYTTLRKINILYEWFLEFTRDRAPLTYNDLIFNGVGVYKRLQHIEELLYSLENTLAQQRLWAARYIMGRWQAHQFTTNKNSIIYTALLKDFYTTRLVARTKITIPSASSTECN
jgi:hypothetical protein